MLWCLHGYCLMKMRLLTMCLLATLSILGMGRGVAAKDQLPSSWSAPLSLQLALLSDHSLIQSDNSAGSIYSRFAIKPIKPQLKVSLTVITHPQDAKVKFINSAENYQQGVQLIPGAYQIEISRPGYHSQSLWIELWREDVTHQVVLQSAEKRDANVILQNTELLREYKDSLSGMEFVLIEPGCFIMGNRFGYTDEKPEHRVCIEHAFYLGKYEVTQQQWQTVMGYNPATFIGMNRPVERVSWYDVQEFIVRLKQKTGRSFRLPTEAEWEYSCQLGSKKRRYCGSDQINQVGWYTLNSGGETHPVGSKLPNAIGIYDMIGNVWELVQDWYAADYYQQREVTAVLGPVSGSMKIFRGGSWYNSDQYSRASFRNFDFPGSRLSIVGFRLALTP